MNLDYLPSLAVLVIATSRGGRLIYSALASWERRRQRRPFCVPCAEPRTGGRCPSCE